MPAGNPLQSVQRVARILYAVAGVEDGRTLNQIAEAVGAKPNTVYKFIRTLEAEHFLIRRKHPIRFSLGHALTELKTLDDGRHLLSVAGKVMVRTQAQMPDGNFNLLEYEHPHTYQRLCVQSRRPGVLIRRREYHVEPYIKASSLLFLAYAHPDEVQGYFRAHNFDLLGKPLWHSRERLEEFLTKVRHLGFSQPDFPDDSWDGYWFRVAVPIFAPGGDVLAAIGGFLPANEPVRSRKLMTRLCREAAVEITKKL